MSERISLKDLDKGAVLAALYNASRPMGMGFLHYDANAMTAGEGRALLENGAYFDYLNGRVMKVDLKGDDFSPGLYDRDNGEDAASRAIEALRASGSADAPEIAEAHRAGTLDAAHHAEGEMVKDTHTEVEGQLAITRLGLADVAPILGPAVAEARSKLRTQ